MEEKKIDGIKLTTTIILVLVTAALFLGVGFWAGGARNVSSTDDTTATATVSTTTTVSASSTSTADITANWKTYTNDTYGFSLKYPSDWAVTDQLQAKGKEASVNKDYLKISKADASITIYFVPAGWDTLQPEITYQVSLKGSKLTLSNRAVVKPSGQDEIAQQLGLIAFKQGDSIALKIGDYDMSVSAENVGLSQEATIVNILSTFQFTK